MSDTDTIILHGQPFSRAQYTSFRQAYEAAREEGKTEYVWAGQPVTTRYAGYVCEYAEQAFGEIDGTHKPAAKSVQEAIDDLRRLEARAKAATDKLDSMLKQLGYDTGTNSKD